MWRSSLKNITFDPMLGHVDKILLDAAWQTGRKAHGDEFTFYLPGMVRYGQDRGQYPAISITSGHCELQCEHCKGRLLAPMSKVSGPDALVEKCIRLSQAGALGVLLSGGSNLEGRLPWQRYYEAIDRVRRETSLFISAHVGFPDVGTCEELKRAGVRQALIDVIGDEETASRVYHLKGLGTVRSALTAISESGLEFVPHVVAGLFFGNIKGEVKALEMISGMKPAALVMVVLTPLKKTPMAGLAPPSSLEVARLIAQARLMMPETPISLGCERPRNRDGALLERLALRAGVTRMAVWSQEAIVDAQALGLRPRFQRTCCSVEFKREFSSNEPL
jgi:hypothetical protein